MSSAELRTVDQEVTELAEYLTRGQSDTFRMVLAGRLQDAIDACHLQLVRDLDHPRLCDWCGCELSDDPEDWRDVFGEHVHGDPCADEMAAFDRAMKAAGPTRQVFRLHAPGCGLQRSHPKSDCIRNLDPVPRPHHPRCCAEDREHLGDYCTVPDDDKVDLTGVSGG